MRAFQITSQQHSLRLPLWLVVTSQPLSRPDLNQFNHSNQVNQRLPAARQGSDNGRGVLHTPIGPNLKNKSASFITII